jgi:hypothetical protein
MKIKFLPNLQQTTIFLIFLYLSLSLFDFQVIFILKNSLTYILLGFLGLSFIFELYPKSKVAKLVRKHTKTIIVIMTAIMVFVLFGKNLQARWGPIDDHEIMSYLGTDQRLSLTEIPKILAGSETGNPGKSLRYRPMYQTLRLVETATWGNNAHLWYIFRLVILVTALALLWYLLEPITGIIPSGLVIVYLLTYQMWADMFSRLGPSETYTVLALAVYAWGYSRLFKQVQNKKGLETLPIIAWALGTFICVGAKENFALLLIPNLLLGLYILYRRNSNKIFTTSFIVTTAWTIFVAAAFVIAVATAGTDVYGSSVGAISRLSVINTGMRHVQSKTIILTTMIAAFFLFVQFWVGKVKSDLFKSTLLFIGLCLVYEAIFISQFVFYNADWPNHSRYDFPGVLIIPFFYGTLLLFVKKILDTYKVEPTVVLGLKYGALLGLIFVIIMRGYVAIQVRIEQNAQKTQAYTAQIEKLAKLLVTNPDKVVIIVSGNPWDYEPIYAYSQFLRAYGVTNTMYLKLENYSPATVANGIEKRLATELQTMQLNGGWGYEPLPENLDNCYSILLTTATTNCEQINN